MSSNTNDQVLVLGPDGKLLSEFALRRDDPSAINVTLIGILGVLAVFLIITLLQVFFLAFEQREIENKLYSQPYTDLVEQTEAQVQELSTAAVLDAETRRVRIPIQSAAQRVLASLSAREPIEIEPIGPAAREALEAASAAGMDAGSGAEDSSAESDPAE